MHPSGAVIANTDHLALAHILSRLHARLDKPATPPERNRQLHVFDRDRDNRRGVGQFLVSSELDASVPTTLRGRGDGQQATPESFLLRLTLGADAALQAFGTLQRMARHILSSNFWAKNVPMRLCT
ncbi:hypothetical protein D3C76_1029140 [compost metagenome]